MKNIKKFKNALKLGSFYLFDGKRVKLIRIISGRFHIRESIVTEYTLETEKGRRYITRDRKKIKKLNNESKTN